MLVNLFDRSTSLYDKLNSKKNLVSFEKIGRLHGKSEAEVIKIMRKNLKPKSFKLWRERVSGRTRKHEKKRYLSSKPFRAEDYV